MAGDRPTFHESWYRVAQLRPRLLSSVRVYRQHFRGQMWYVLEDAATNRFSRISKEAYRFIAMLDGQRTVTQAWRICNEELGDNAPTQPEVIRLLGLLHTSNLLYAQLPPDTESLFNRYRTRTRRAIQGYLTNLLFIRIPLLDPDHFLDRWVGVVGSLFSVWGLILWLLLLTTGLYFVITNFSEFVHQSRDILKPGNLFLLSLSFWLIKIFHEFSHAFACKKFGRLNRGGGQVHTIGIMFLVFFPLPYMDASSAWAFRSKWHRAVVGSAGMLVELAAAAVAAIIWANTSTGTVHIITYNMIFIASISTLLFNGNPLLRFDGYYILCDLVEIPNLSSRSRSYLYYLVKRYCWGLKKTTSPATTLGECIWFVIYGITSTAYRVFISIRILLFLNRRLPEELYAVVPVLACTAIIGWVFVPLAGFFRYLLTGSELVRKRMRAIGSTLVTLAMILVLLAVLRVPNHARVEGIVEPVRLAVVYAKSDGFVQDYLPSGTYASVEDAQLIKMVNPVLEAEEKQLLAEHSRLVIRRRLAETREPAEVQIIEEQIRALDEKIERVRVELSELDLRPAWPGTWIAPDIELTKGVYLRRGDRVGLIASLDDVFVRVVVGQDEAELIEQAYEQVELRVRGRPDLALFGRKGKISAAGLQLLPSAALGYSVGGSMPTLAKDPRGTQAAERFFEIQVIPESGSSVRLLSGQRVVARFEMPPKPLVAQWWRTLRQLFLRRFHI